MTSTVILLTGKVAVYKINNNIQKSISFFIQMMNIALFMKRKGVKGIIAFHNALKIPWNNSIQRNKSKQNAYSILWMNTMKL